MKYQWILFDADETLFSFNSYLGLKSLLKRYDIEFTEQSYEEFQAVNKPLWEAYQNQQITIQQLQQTRFEKYAEKTGQDPLVLNQQLMDEMALVSKPLPKVMDMLNTFFPQIKMGIITNGLESLQQQRLDNTKTSHFFEFVVVSETIGMAKPDTRIFEEAFRQMGNVDKSQVLMVGDTLSSDILGANQAGIDSCWFNPQSKPNITTIQPKYEIHSMDELIKLVSNSFYS